MPRVGPVLNKTTIYFVQNGAGRGAVGWFPSRLLALVAGAAPGPEAQTRGRAAPGSKATDGAAGAPPRPAHHDHHHAKAAEGGARRRGGGPGGRGAAGTDDHHQTRPTRHGGGGAATRATRRAGGARRPRRPRRLGAGASNSRRFRSWVGRHAPAGGPPSHDRRARPQGGGDGNQTVGGP